MIRKIFFILFVWLMYIGPTCAYKTDTHEDLSEAALGSSSLANDPEVLRNLGLKPLVEKQQFPNSRNDDLSITELIRDGSSFEDAIPRPLNHFYDPVNNRGLTPLLVPVGFRSPDWALEDTQQFGDQQNYSFRDARENFYLALTEKGNQSESGEKKRDKRFGLLFQTLGQIIHHLQDMSQPQHTRNDAHLTFGKKYDITPVTNRSRMDGLDPFGAGSYAPPVLARAREYWYTSDGRGIADYSNRGFVSEGTNFDTNKYVFPIFDPSTAWEVVRT